MILRNLVTFSFAVAGSTPLMAMQPLGDESMAAVSGQSGITIEMTTQNPDGDFLTTGAIRFTENDKDGKGQDYLEIGSLEVTCTHRNRWRRQNMIALIPSAQILMSTAW